MKWPYLRDSEYLDNIQAIFGTRTRGVKTGYVVIGLNSRAVLDIPVTIFSTELVGLAQMSPCSSDLRIRGILR
jgi:hypothetical protein